MLSILYAFLVASFDILAAISVAFIELALLCLPSALSSSDGLTTITTNNDR